METTEMQAPTENLQPVSDAGASALEKLREENEALRKKLSEVVDTASSNEKIWRHFAEIERILFRTRELDSLAEELLREIKLRFKPDQVVLLICHPDLLERFFPDISAESGPIDEGTWILPCREDTGSDLCGDTPRPQLLAPEDIEGLRGFMPESPTALRSGVIIPLSIHHVLFGGLFLGSADSDRYKPGTGTDLLEQLGIKVALSMDNCLSYERVKEFTVQDPVTGLLNFFQIHTILEREFRKARRNETALSALIIDLNFVRGIQEDFDSANDVLKHVSGLLTEILPEKGTFLGRYGSDEFLLVLPEIRGEEAREVIPFLSNSIFKTPFRHKNTAILIQAEMGLGTLTDDMERPRDLLDAAYAELCRLKIAHPEPGE